MKTANPELAKFVAELMNYRVSLMDALTLSVAILQEPLTVAEVLHAFEGQDLDTRLRAVIERIGKPS